MRGGTARPAASPAASVDRQCRSRWELLTGVHTPEQTHVLRGTMKKLQQLLDPARFVRVHRSTIMNGRHVKSMRSHTNGEYFLTLDCYKELKMSRTYKANIDRLMPAS